MSYSKKDEDADAGIFTNIDKVQVFQEARIFNQSNISPRKCRQVLSKIAYLLDTGETFGSREATELFFGITKLFQHKDPALRQMVYVVIKQMATISQDVIMVTSIIMKDTSTSSETLYKPNSIRTLCRIIDATTVPAIERLIKTAIVDKIASVSSAALVSSYHLLPIARDVVRRWVNETQEAALSASVGSQVATTPYFTQLGYKTPPSSLTQYHALGLLYQMRRHDRMAITKLIQQFTSKSSHILRHPFSITLMVRFISNLAHEDPNSRPAMFRLLESYLRNKSDGVSIEAAKAICDLPDLSDAETSSAISALQILLTSPRFVTRFAAIRMLNRFAMTRPNLVHTANEEIENLITDQNRSIATFAITTLLKTGSEASVDRLMKQIQNFMEEISDEFKVIVVDAVRSLCLKFPKKQGAMVKLLADILHDEGGFEFKAAAVDAVFDLIKYVPDSKDEALSHLCEFIEDCEYAPLAVRILHLLGVEGPKTKNPSKFIRYIYNRVVLENATVRAAAVNALARFASDCADPGVQKSVRVLLRRCLDDPDDEVRDRAAVQLNYISKAEKLAQSAPNRSLIPFLNNDSGFSLQNLEETLVLYVTGDSFDKPFNVSAVPVVTRQQTDAEALQKKASRTQAISAPKAENGAAAKSNKQRMDGNLDVPAAHSMYVEQLGRISNFNGFGPVLKSSVEPTYLTERETEYVTTVVTHVFENHLVLQFDIENTLTDNVLENVSMVTAPVDSEAFEDDFIIPAPVIGPNETGIVYVCYRRTGMTSLALTEFTNTLQFTIKEIDPATNEPEENGYEDEYQVENYVMSASVYIIPVPVSGFGEQWERLSAGNEASETYVLDSMNSIQDAIGRVATQLSMHPAEGTQVASSEPVHRLKLAGKTTSGTSCLADVRMVYAAKNGVTIKLTVRSEDVSVSAMIVENF